MAHREAAKHDQKMASIDQLVIPTILIRYRVNLGRWEALSESD